MRRVTLLLLLLAGCSRFTAPEHRQCVTRFVTAPYVDSLNRVDTALYLKTTCLTY